MNKIFNKRKEGNRRMLKLNNYKKYIHGLLFLKKITIKEFIYIIT